MRGVRLVYTGGTVGGLSTANSHTVDADASQARFEEQLRVLLPDWAKGLPWDITSSFQKLSEHMVPADWTRIAHCVDQAIRAGKQGVVVAHGTDTLMYSAAAVAMMLQNAPVPVVFTGANAPLEAPQTDAVQNLSHALLVATHPDIKGVVVSFAGTPNGTSLVISGTRVRKTSWRPDCFQPSGREPIGRVEPRGVNDTPQVILDGPGVAESPRTADEGAYTPRIGIERRVAFFQLHPGFDPELLRIAVERGAKGLVLGAYGVGTLCTEGPCSVTAVVRSVLERRVPIFIVSQHYGDVSLLKYGSSAELLEAGCVGLGDMTPEVAVAKLMWVLSQSADYNEVRRLTQTPVAGEV